MSKTHLISAANQLPRAWASTIVGQAAGSNVKVLRMDGAAYPDESHDFDEALLVLDGCMRLDLQGQVTELEGIAHPYIQLREDLRIYPDRAWLGDALSRTVSARRRLQPELLALDWQQATRVFALSIIDIMQVPLPLAISVLEDNIVLYSRDDTARLLAEARLMSKWELDYQYHQAHYA